MIEFYLFVNFQAVFETLDPEVLAATTNRFHKSVFQLEKGLPPNNVVPTLKDKVESMKNKVSVLYSVNMLSIKPMGSKELYNYFFVTVFEKQNLIKLPVRLIYILLFGKRMMKTFLKIYPKILQKICW